MIKGALTFRQAPFIIFRGFFVLVLVLNWVSPGKRVLHENGYTYGYSINDQQAWISSRLDKGTRGSTHAFVLSHQNLIGENHQDSLFAGYTDANPEWQNAFFASLQKNEVKYYTIGYYIFTIDGPRVTVDYFFDDHGKSQSDANYPNGPGLPDKNGITPTFNFVKKEIRGYTLGGN